jgi:hypothetical protein
MENDVPAFPFEYEGDGGQRITHTGMGLRDYFAGQAMIHIATITPVEVAAKMSYALADAMLKARSHNDRE